MKNLNVLITGGSKGLGLALGQQLSAKGANVVLVARGQGPLDEAVASIRAGGGVAHGIAADVGDKQAIHKISGQAAALVGPIDVVIHDASTLGPTPLRPLLDTTCEDLERVFAVNVVGPFRLTKALAGPMVMRGRGTIVFVSSDAAVSAYPTWGAYGASKAGADHLARILGAELEKTGVKVLVIDPGEMDTEMHAAAMPEADRTTLAAPSSVARTIIDRIAAVQSSAVQS